MSQSFADGRSRRGMLLAFGMVAFAVVGVLFHASYAFHGIALFDEGLLADGAWRVLMGERIGRDHFVPYGPASYWVLAPCFAWFGTSLATVRWVTVVIQALAGSALFGLAAARGSWFGGVAAAALVAVAHGSLHKSFLLLAVIAVLCAVARIGRKVDPMGALQAGALAGAAFLFRHDVGAFAGVALLVAACAERNPARTALAGRLAALAGGFVAVVGPAVIALVAAGLDLEAWWTHERQRIAIQERIDVDLVTPWQEGGATVGRSVLFVAIGLAPLIHLLHGGGALLRLFRGTPRDGDAARIGGAVFGLLLLNQARLIPSPNHLFQALAPVALALADLLARRDHGAARRTLLAVTVAAVVAWAATGRQGAYSGTFRQRIPGAVPLNLPTAGVLLRPEFAAGLERVVAAIQSRTGPEERIVTSPGTPLLGFLAQRRLALPWSEPSFCYHHDELQQEAIRAVERHRPPLFIHDGSEPANYRFEEAAPLLAAHLAARYRPIDTIGPFTLFERWR